MRTLIERPYRLEGQFADDGPKGGGWTEFFRLSDVIARCRAKQDYKEKTMTPCLIAAHQKETAQ